MMHEDLENVCDLQDEVKRLQAELNDEARADVEINEIVGKYMDDAERLQAQVAQLREALDKIADPADPGSEEVCKCEDHNSPDCCVAADYYCPQCIAGKALASTASSTEWLAQKLRAAGAKALREAADELRKGWSEAAGIIRAKTKNEGIDWLRARAEELEKSNQGGSDDVTRS